jgi:hypothetical protein
MQLDVARTFEEFGCELSLSQVDTNLSEGHLIFEMEADTLDEQKAKSTGVEWIQRNLIDSYLLLFGRYLRPEFDAPVLLNEPELVGVPRTFQQELRIVGIVRVSLPIANVGKSLELKKKLEEHADKELLERSLRWFRKARDTDDAVDGFVMQWIAFNSLYSLFDPGKKGDRTAINNLLNALPSVEKTREILATHENTIKALTSKALTDWRGKKNYSDELRSLTGSKDLRGTLRVIGLCLLVIRNEVFHGGTRPSEETDFLRECWGLVESMYRECLCSYVGLT